MINIYKYRLAANITEYHKKSKLILQSLLQTFIVQRVIRGKVQYRIWNPHRISSNQSINKKLDFCGPDSHLGKVQYRIWNPHRISKSKKKNIQIGPETTKLCFS